MRRRWILYVLVSVVGLGGAAFWAFRTAMVNGWIRYNEYDIRSPGLLQVGDLVPDLELATVDGSGRLRLSDFYGAKPTVLAFGSYT